MGVITQKFFKIFVSTILICSLLVFPIYADDSVVVSDDGLSEATLTDIVISYPESDSVSAYSDDDSSSDVVPSYDSASIQYYRYSSTSANNGSVISNLSTGLVNKESSVVNGILGYTTFSSLVQSSSVKWNSLSYSRFYSRFSYVNSRNGSGDSEANSYFDFVNDERYQSNYSSWYSTYMTDSSNVADYVSLNGLYMTMNIEVPARSYYDLSNLNFNFTVGSYSYSGIYYMLGCGSRYMLWDFNVYVDGSAIYQSAQNNKTATGYSSVEYNAKSGFVSLANGKLSNYLSEPYLLTNYSDDSVTYSVSLELLPYINYQSSSDIVSVPGYGNTAMSSGYPVIVYGNSSFASNVGSIFDTSTFTFNSSNTPSSGAVSDDSVSLLTSVSSNGYYLMMWLEDVSTGSNGGVSVLIYDTLMQLLDGQNSIAGALLDNPMVISYLDSSTGSVVSVTVNGLVGMMQTQGSHIDESTGRLAYMYADDSDIALKQDTASIFDSAVSGFIDSGDISSDASDSLNDIKDNVKDMFDTGYSVSDFFDGISDGLSWFSQAVADDLDRVGG